MEHEELCIGEIWCGNLSKTGYESTGEVLAWSVCLSSQDHQGDCLFIAFPGKLATTDLHGNDLWDVKALNEVQS